MRRTGLFVALASLIAVALPAAASADVSVTATGGAIDSLAGSAGGNEAGIANPFPASVNVATVGTVTDVNVTLANGTHIGAGDLDIALEAPNGAASMFWSDACVGFTNRTYTFDDSAPIFAPSAGSNCPDGSTFKPTNFEVGGEGFLNGGPQEPFNVAFATLNGVPSQGAWDLWVYDDDTNAGITGPQGFGSWTLNLTVNPSNVVTGSLNPLDNGKGELVLTIPNPGTVSVSDANLPAPFKGASAAKKKKKKPSIKAETLSVVAGQVTIPIKARGKANGKIKSGKGANINVRVSYTPTGGTPAEQTFSARFKKKKK